MKTSIILILFANILALTQCSKENVDGHIEPIYVKHYINNYRAVEQFYFETDASDSLVFWFDGRLYTEDSKDSDIQTCFLELAELNGDVCDRKIPGFYAMFPRIAYENLASLDIRCDKNWDAVHPAGISLSDICVFGSWSYASCIASDYNNLTPEWISKKVEDLTTGDMKMLTSWNQQKLWRSSLKFLSFPSEAGTYTLTVTFTTVKGNMLSAKQKIIIL